MNDQTQKEYSELLYELIKKSPAMGYGSRIPMKTFELIEADLRIAMRAHKVRATFRGPRRSNRGLHKPGRTCRCDAKFVSIWYAAE